MHPRVRGPAIALILIGVLGLIQALGCVAFALLMGNAAAFPTIFHDESEEELKQMRIGAVVVFLPLVLFLVAGSGVVIFAALRLLKQKAWTLGVVASILVMIPCFSGSAFVLGIPIGIWALVVLLNDEVRRSFDPANAS